MQCQDDYHCALIEPPKNDALFVGSLPLSVTMADVAKFSLGKGIKTWNRGKKMTKYECVIVVP